MGSEQPIRAATASAAAELPDKFYFRIGEVAQLCGVPTYVLRFWESEFPQLKPGKGGSGQRLYRRRDVEVALRVRTLLKDEGYTIPGARAVLKAEYRQKEPQLSLLPAPTADAGPLRRLRRELAALLEELSVPGDAKDSPTQRRSERPRPQRPRRKPTPGEAADTLHFGAPPTEENSG